MSIRINIGQGGNQVGEELLAHEALLGNACGREKQRSIILVDSEPKVVNAIASRYNVAAAHTEQSGRGNNWAMGYHGQKNENLINNVLESLRKEMESIPYYRGAVLTHSLAGGTGAGLGCLLLEAMRDTYPKAYLANCCLAPSLMGDTPLQNYNALLSFAHLQEYSDAIFLKDNDDLMRCVKHWQGKPNAVSLQDMNRLAAADWIGLFLRTIDNRGVDLGALITQVCPMSSAKLVDVKSVFMEKKLHASRICAVVRSPDQDSGVIDATKHLLASYATNRSFGRHVIYRGSFPTDNVLQTIEKACPLPSWFPHGTSFSSFSSLPQSLTVCSNGQTNAPTLINAFLARGRKQLDARAYVHWYERYGIDTSYFVEAFERCEQIVVEYGQLS